MTASPTPEEIAAIAGQTLRTAEADTGCRIPPPFNEVALHAIELTLLSQENPK